MHHWEAGGSINIGWPDFSVPEREYTLVEVDLQGQVFRGRVTDGQKEGGFMVVLYCPGVVLGTGKLEKFVFALGHILNLGRFCELLEFVVRILTNVDEL